MAKKTADYEEFIRIYNGVDQFMRTQAQDSSRIEHVYLIEQLTRTSALIARHAQDLRVFAQLRNVLIHNPFMRIANPIAVPAASVVEHYRHIEEALTNPPSAMSIAVPSSKLYSCHLTTNVTKVIYEMNKNTYTHVPVMDGKKMVGVFSENTILAYLAHHKDAIITQDMSVGEFEDFIKLDSHTSESFEFISRKAPLHEVYEVFNRAIKARRRIGALFITETGKPTEQVLGLITAWDLALPELASSSNSR